MVALARQEMGQGKKRPQMSPYTGHFCKEPFSADVTPRQTWHLSMAALCEFAFSTFVHCHLISSLFNGCRSWCVFLPSRVLAPHHHLSNVWIIITTIIIIIIATAITKFQIQIIFFLNAGCVQRRWWMVRQIGAQWCRANAGCLSFGRAGIKRRKGKLKVKKYKTF